MMMDGIFGIIALGCGLYCLYAWYMLAFRKEIKQSILLPKDVNVKKCKDVEGYCREASKPLLGLGIVTSLYGASDLYNTYVGGADVIFLVFLVLMLVMLVVYVVLVRRCNQKYFGIK